MIDANFHTGYCATGKLKVVHWSGSSGYYCRKAAPMLEIASHFIFPTASASPEQLYASSAVRSFDAGILHRNRGWLHTSGANAKSKLCAPHDRGGKAALSRSRQIPVGRKNV